LRDSEIEEERTTNGKTEKFKLRFRDSIIGRKIVAARLHDATALYEHCPTALIFGTWDSTAGEGLDSAKIPRAVVSEIVAVDITPGVRTASRIDPLGIRAQSATVYRFKDHENDWTLEESEAARTDKGEAKKFGKGKPSDINHGNVTPDMPRFDSQEIRKQKLDRLPDLLETTPLQLRYELSSSDGRIDTHGSFRSDEVRISSGAVKPGGITVDHAVHTWTLSLTQLRRLRFPLPAISGTKEASVASAAADVATNPNQTSGTQEQRDEAARTVLAALALYALALQQEKGYWLRSRCELLPSEPVVLERIGAIGGSWSLGSPADVKKIFDAAIAEAEKVGVKWSKTFTLLEPTEKLKKLVSLSDARGPEPEPEEEPADAGAAS
jgi:CRISPR-associated protein Csb1